MRLYVLLDPKGKARSVDFNQKYMMDYASDYALEEDREYKEFFGFHSEDHKAQNRYLKKAGWRIIKGVFALDE